MPKPIEDVDFKNIEKQLKAEFFHAVPGDEGKDAQEASNKESSCYFIDAEAAEAIEPERFEQLGVTVSTLTATVQFWKNPRNSQLIATIRYVGRNSPEPGTTLRADNIPAQLGKALSRHLRGMNNNLEPDLESAVHNWLEKSDRGEWIVIRRNNDPV